MRKICAFVAVLGLAFVVGCGGGEKKPPTATEAAGDAMKKAGEEMKKAGEEVKKAGEEVKKEATK